MRQPMSLVLFAGLIAGSALGDDRKSAVQPSNSREGFTTLFNGKDFTGWHGLKTMDPRQFDAISADEKSKALAEGAEDMKKHWKVQDGVIVNDGQGVYLTTDKDYGDIELLVDWKIGPQGDSGVYLRATPQVQIWDFTEPRYASMGADKGSGGLWNNSPGAAGRDPLVRADNPVGQWNTFRIIQVGARTTIYLNDKLIVDHAILENYWKRSVPIPARGPVQLQTHDHELLWRNISIREIPADEANQILAKHGSSGFQPIFNGQDLTGWAGPIENYEVKDGALRCKPDEGGTIYFNKELTNFMARVEFKLPPGGNNGLAIRYPGKGDTAYHGMCELQILDDGHPKYGKSLDARQAHGSAYGMVAAARGYLRPIGEWNFEEVTVQGSKIKVELNGTIILDTDLSNVKEFMNNSAHPGKDRTSGYFGFAGHNDPVEFRNVAIKVLE
jgi:Domain of Unknown Function (DUF1080)